MSNMGRLELCKREIKEISEFKRVQIYCFLETFTSVKVSDKQKIDKLMRSVLTETLVERILDVFLGFLEEYDNDAYEKLKKPSGGFSSDEVFSLITDSIRIEDSETKTCFLSALWNTEKDLFEGKNLFVETLNSDGVRFIESSQGFSKEQSAYILAKILDDGKGFLFIGDHGHDLLVVSKLSEIEMKNFLDAYSKRNELFKNQMIFDSYRRVRPEIRESFFECNKELFKKVIPDGNPCDIYSVKEILDANEDEITLVKKILCNNKRNGFLVSINSDGVDDRDRVMNTVAHLCQSAGIDLYEIGDRNALKEFSIDDVMNYIRSIGGALFLCDTTYASELSLGEITCSMFTDISPYKNESQENNEFNPEIEVNSMCEKIKEMSNIGRVATYIWEFKKPSGNNYLHNCMDWLESTGYSKESAMELSEQCFENKIPYYEWPHMALISDLTYGCSKEDMRQIVESFSPKNTKKKNQKCDRYNIDVLNTSVDMNEIVEEIRNAAKWKEIDPSGDYSYKALFYGISGGGKSEAAKYIADSLKKNLICVKPSDYERRYSGESERIIRALFKRAEKTDSIILLDECDAILINRKGSVLRWEISIINEMIQQIESFGGILFATTNLRKILDPAMDRRFTSKVEFFAMKKEGVEKLCDTYFGRFNLDADDVQQICNAGEVCPGDFHVVQSRIKVMDPSKVNKDTIRDSLVKVVREKNAEEGAKIGFGR